MNATPMQILVVDDSADTARMMALLLKAEGHKVKTASDGTAALRAAREQRPDVILLDLSLPDLDGTEVAEQLRRTEGLEGLSIVAVSGRADRPVSPAFDGHFTKPVDHEALNGFLSRLAVAAP